MANNENRSSDKRDINLGQATYTVERVFAGEKTVSELIVNKIVNDKELLPMPTKYDNVG